MVFLVKDLVVGDLVFGCRIAIHFVAGVIIFFFVLSLGLD